MTSSSEALFTATGYHFRNAALLEQALTHRSANPVNNERLEFLGDAILGSVIAIDLYRRFPTADEGQLTRLRSDLVRRQSLASIAREMELGEHIRLGGGELKSGGWRRDSILENTVEALVGAIYLDAGNDTVTDCVLRWFDKRLEGLHPDAIHKDPKTTLQEYLQAHKRPLPRYIALKEEGEPHCRRFTVACQVDGLAQDLVAEADSRRKAEQLTAGLALEQLQKDRGHD